MSATNVVEITNEITEQPLSVADARDLHSRTVSETVRSGKTPSEVIKAGRAFGRATLRKVLRAEFAGLTPEQIVAHCENL